MWRFTSRCANHLIPRSDPFHERYGQHLSKEEVDELIAPHPESVNQVNEWLASHGISEASLSRTASGDWVKVKVPVSLAEKMLDTVRDACIAYDTMVLLMES